MLALAALLACSTPSSAERYAQALAAPSFDAAWSLCGAVSVPSDRADCQQATAVRFQRFDACDRVPAGAWREECHFGAAESLARTGDRTGALRGCQATVYAANCEQHVLDGAAMLLRDGTAEAVAEAWTGVAEVAKGKNSQIDFWRSWHRVRLDAGMPVVGEACPNAVCKNAVKAEGRKRARIRAEQAGCDAAVPADVGGDPLFTAAVAEEHERVCVRRPPVQVHSTVAKPEGIEPTRQTE